MRHVPYNRNRLENRRALNKKTCPIGYSVAHPAENPHDRHSRRAVCSPILTIT